jgi:hypothetical protein
MDLPQVRQSLFYVWVLFTVWLLGCASIATANTNGLEMSWLWSLPWTTR